MPPKLNASQDDLELFRSRLENIIDQRHPLVRLARLIDWRVFEERFGALYAEAAERPALLTRLMVALHLLKHMDGLPDEAICARYLDSPYVQAFCGETHFQHTLLLDRSSMTRWRKRIGPSGWRLCSPRRWRPPSGVGSWRTSTTSESRRVCRRAGRCSARSVMRATARTRTAAAMTAGDQ